MSPFWLVQIKLTAARQSLFDYLMMLVAMLLVGGAVGGSHHIHDQNCQSAKSKFQNTHVDSPHGLAKGSLSFVTFEVGASGPGPSEVGPGSLLSTLFLWTHVDAPTVGAVVVIALTAPTDRLPAGEPPQQCRSGRIP